MRDEKLLEIVSRAIAGDEAAFVELCEVKARDILYMSIQLMGNMHDGEDVAQEILLHMKKHISHLHYAEAFHVWMYRIIKSKCLNRMRDDSKKLREKEKEEIIIMEDRDNYLPQEYTGDETKKAYLMQVVGELPFQCKMCVYMFYYQCMQYDDIADALLITVKDVDNALMKSKRVIKMKFEESQLTEAVASPSVLLLPVPVFSQMIAEEIGRQVTREAAANLLVNCGIGTIKAVGAAAQVSTAAQASTATKASTLSSGTKSAVTITKIGAGGLLVAGAAAAGILAVSRYRNVIDQEQPVAAITAEEQESAPVLKITEAVEEESEIEVLADMIGIGPEHVLQGYASAGSVDVHAVEAFLEEHQVRIQEGIYQKEVSEEHAMYIREQQNKRLVVIIRYRTEEQGAELAYQFTDADEEIPENVEIPRKYTEWKGQNGGAADNGGVVSEEEM